MNRISLAALATLVCAHAALASDLPVPRAAPPVPYADSINWTGIYVGVNAGYSRGSGRETYRDAYTDYDRSIRMPGWLMGIQVGAQKQFGMFVVGLEADGQWTNQRGSSTETECLYAYYGHCKVSQTTIDQPRLNWFSTARLRAGLLVHDRVLVYATGGGAYGSMTNTHRNWIDFFGYQTPTTTITTRQAVAGTAVGGGIEAKMTQRISVKAEYLRLDMRALNTTVHVTGAGQVSNYRETLTDNIFRIGLNYHF